MDPTFGPSIRTKYLLLLDPFFCFSFRESEVNRTNVIGGIRSSLGHFGVSTRGRKGMYPGQRQVHGPDTQRRRDGTQRLEKLGRGHFWDIGLE